MIERINKSVSVDYPVWLMSILEEIDWELFAKDSLKIQKALLNHIFSNYKYLQQSEYYKTHLINTNFPHSLLVILNLIDFDKMTEENKDEFKFYFNNLLNFEMATL
jgi:hypothetical protein